MRSTDKPLCMEKNILGTTRDVFFQEWEGEPDVNDERS